MLAVLCPGQGAQSARMLTAWMEHPAVAARLRWSAAVTGLDLPALGTTGSDEEVRDTAVAQPLLAALAIGVGELLLADPRPPVVLAGHSVGEWAAAALAGAVSAETALTLVAARGRAMAVAAGDPPTGMSAVLGGAEAEVLSALAAHDLVAANVNIAGQVVAAGRLDDLAALAAEPPPRARVRPLSVAGAFHTPFMASARAALAPLAQAAPVTSMHTVVVANGDGAVVNDARTLLDRMVEQVARPVRWDLCMQTLTELGVTAVVELAPGGTLAALVRRAMPGVETVAVTTPDDLPAAAAVIDRHRTADTEPAPPWRLAVAPVAGTFRAADVSPGSSLSPGGTVGRVVSQRAESTVSAVHGGVLVEWLAADGDPVGPGQAVALLHPEPTPA